MPKIAVIILSYNGIRHLPACIDSVTRQSYPSGEYRIVVVDNASDDGSTAWVAEHCPHVKVIANSNNKGYAGGNNVGIQWAREQGYDYMVLLNQDMRVADGWLKNLVAVAEQDDRIGIVQSKILSAAQEYRINTAGNPLHYLGFSWSGGYKRLSSEFLENIPIPLASGGSLLIKSAVIEKIGLLDEYMFLYHEDADWSWRARRAGFDVWLAAESKAYHHYFFSIGGKKFYWSERNRLIALFSNYRAGTLLVLAPWFVVTEAALLVYAFFSGWLKHKIKSYGGFVLAIPHIAKRRRMARSYRSLTDRQMMEWMTSKFDFEDIDNMFIRFVFNPLSAAYFWLAKKIVRW